MTNILLSVVPPIVKLHRTVSGAPKPTTSPVKKELKLNPKQPTLSEASDVLLLLLSENLHELIKPVSDLRRENI